ncbi:hypothetical protein FRC02_010560 [Tulasnella sp. 418]|nr:hypothetical protein FRC02_010560 [Tulasnella sp. 418]
MLPVPEPRLESLSMKNILDLWRKGNLLYQIYIGQAIALFAEPDYKTHLNFLDQWSNDLQKIVETTFQARLTDPETYGRYYQLILDFLMGGLVSGMFRFAVVGGDDDITLCYRGLKIAQAIIEGIQDPAQLQVACSHIMMTGLDVRVMTAALCKVHPILNSVAIICLRDMFTRSCVSESLTATELSTLLTICVSCFNLNRTEMAKEQWRAPKSILRQGWLPT